MSHTSAAPFSSATKSQLITPEDNHAAAAHRLQNEGKQQRWRDVLPGDNDPVLSDEALDVIAAALAETRAELRAE